MNVQQHPHDQFTVREQEVIAALLRAESAKEIADRLSLSLNTVSSYLKSIYVKAGVHSARELMVKLHADQDYSHESRLGIAALRVLGAGGYDGVHAVLTCEAMRCTGARQVSFWCLDRTATPGILRPASGRAQVTIPITPFIDSVVRLGSAHLVTDNKNPLLNFALQAAGVSGDLIGAIIDTRLREEIMLVADPPRAEFDDEAYIAVRVLARIAELRFCATGRAMAATA